MAISSNGVAGLKPGVIDTSAALPASPFEGQMVYQKDTDQLLVWNGTAWRILASATATSGSVLQVKSFSTTTNTSNATNSAVSTAITLAITPSSTSSKILVSGTTGAISKGAYRTWMDMSIFRNSTNIDNIGYLFDQSTTATAASFSGQAFSVLDSPATTSSTTYTIKYLSALGGNIDVSGGHITLMEIAG
jgi:hypothetical protein